MTAITHGKRLRQALCAVAAVAALIACSTPTVYLITEGLSAEEATTLQTKITELNYDVKLSNVVVPEHFADNTIAINPGNSRADLLIHIEQLLLQITGNTTRIQRFGEGNHFYSGNNIGVYVRNPKHSQQAFPNPFLRSSACPQQDGLLNIKSDGSFALEYVYYHDEAQQLHYEYGTWQWQDSVLQLNFNQHLPQSYQHQRQNVQTYQGLNPSDHYQPRTTHALAIANCEWRVIHMRR